MIYIKKFENNHYDNNDLINAVLNSDIDLVRELIEDDNIDINFKDSSNSSALYYATSINEFEMVILFVNSGADINMKNSQGDTALIMSILYDIVEICKFLLMNGADWRIKNNDNEDFLDYLKPNQDDVIYFIKKHYPECYNEYLLRMEIKKYNL